jgi:hypothetical protein
LRLCFCLLTYPICVFSTSLDEIEVGAATATEIACPFDIESKVKSQMRDSILFADLKASFPILNNEVQQYYAKILLLWERNTII